MRNLIEIDAAINQAADLINDADSSYGARLTARARLMAYLACGPRLLRPHEAAELMGTTTKKLRQMELQGLAPTSFYLFENTRRYEVAEIALAAVEIRTAALV